MRIFHLLITLCLCLPALLGCGGFRISQVPGLSVLGSANIEVQARVEVQAVPLDGSGVVEFFGVPLEGAQDVVFVLDRSGSMAQSAGGSIAHLSRAPAPAAVAPAPAAANQPAPVPAGPSKFDVASAELEQAIARLPEGTRVNVLYFNNYLEAFAPDLVPLDATSRARASEFAKRSSPSGSTALGPALRTAFLMNARQVVLLSDGLGNIGGSSEDTIRDAREAMRGGVRIDVIGLGQNQDAAFFRTLTSESGGVYQPL